MREKTITTLAKDENRRGGVQIQSVARALEIMKCFVETPELGISELSAEMGLHKSTVFGLVNTLASYGYLEQIESAKKYRLGMALFEICNLVLNRIDIRSEAKGRCAPLAQKYPATVYIATYNMDEVIYIDKIDDGHSLIHSSNVGKDIFYPLCDRTQRTGFPSLRLAMHKLDVNSALAIVSCKGPALS